MSSRPIAGVVALGLVLACTLAPPSGERSSERCAELLAPPAEEGRARTGCPAPEDVAEADMDEGLVDERDRDEDGDEDGDGVAGRDDECPGAPGPAPRGCPDSDHDLLLDPDDACPFEQETRNNYRDGDGCPDALPAELAPYAGVVAGIDFAAHSDALRPESRRVLDGAAAALRRDPAQRVVVRVHTESVGGREFNLASSQRRAEVIVAELIARGVAASRLEAEGVGEREPILCCSGPEVCGPHPSRRVEFKLLP
ncbi:MAG: OmpA family protein [Myxococcales bacterium]|nr:OmpA family protein [Myxococcales bacterium]MCB9754963.1 OmpA family protein [Myxococcales bacterium]